MLKIHSLITWKFKVYTTLWNTKNSIYYMFVGSILHKQYFFCFSGIMVGFYTFCESITSIMSTVFFWNYPLISNLFRVVWKTQSHNRMILHQFNLKSLYVFNDI